MFWFCLITGIFGFYVTKYKLNLANPGILIGTVGAPFLVFLTLTRPKIMFPIFLLLVAVFLLYQYINNGTDLRRWRKTKRRPISPYQFADIARSSVEGSDSDGNAITYKKGLDDIPYNRTNFFEEGSQANNNLDEIFPIFSDFKPADNDMSFQEYGYLVTTMEVIVKNQVTVSKGRGKKEYHSNNVILPFSGVYKVTRNGKKMTILYKNHTHKTIKLDNESAAKFLQVIFKVAIRSGWTKNCDSVINQFKNIDYQQKEAEIDKSLRSVETNLSNNNYARTSVMENATNFRTTIHTNQINDRFGGGQGHGHVGEQFGDALSGLKPGGLKDSILGKNTMLGNDHKKWGPDRSYRGQNIQTKYNSTASKSIGQAFYNNGHKETAKYLNSDGSMMKIEVPKDQYPKAVKAMENRIRNGQVPHESNPQNAYKYVEKGALTLEHSKIATQSIFDRNSTIVIDGQVKNVTFKEKLIYSAGGDFVTGIKAGLPTATVTGVWVLCNNLWRGEDIKTSIQNASKVAVISALSGGALYVGASQFGGSKLASKYLGTQFGKKLTKDAIANETLGVVSVAITLGPDIVNSLRGRISTKQLAKDSLVLGASGLIGLGASAIFGPLGTAVVGTVSYASTKMLADHFVEDDAVEMTRILKEEFIENIFSAPLSPNEFSKIQTATFDAKRTPKLLKTMYASGNPRKFIHDLLNGMVVDKLKERPIDENLIINTFKDSAGEYAMA